MGLATLTLDAGLIDSVTGGKAVLFLGAGASLGARRKDGAEIPAAAELGKRIATEFLGSGYDNVDFKTICDFAASARSGRELQTFIYQQLSGFEPASFHFRIPRFVWGGIATTNYDLVLEGAYEATKDRLQDLVSNCKDGDGAPERLGSNGVLYVKLHGCITHYQEVHPPLIASTEQIINHKQGRAGQFAQFLEWARTKTIIFAGYGLGDFNLRVLFDEMRKDGDGHPWHYIVRPNIQSAEADYWHQRRARTISTDFESFLTTIDATVNPITRGLALHPISFTGTSFTRFIAKSGVSESPPLLKFLESQCEHVSKQSDMGTGTPPKFYRGFDLGWYPIANNLDVHRRLTQVLLDERVIANQAIVKPQFVVLKGHAGSGKSVILRRLAWDAALKFDRLIFRLQNGSGLVKELFDEIFQLTNQTVFVIIDDAAENPTAIAEFYRHAQRQKWPLVLIGGARVNEWNTRCEELETLIDEEYELRYLNEREIDGLLDLLEKHKCLGHLSNLRIDERRQKLKEVYSRQLLVALHEATENASFREIISNEYDQIFPVEARLLYLDICSLHRFGSPVRAGLIARVHDIDFEEFNTRFFKPLEEVIKLERDSKTQDWVYRARHSVIADIVYNVCLKTTQEKFDNIIRILTKLNPAYSYDSEVISELLRASRLVELFKDRTLGNDIYEAALKSVGEESFIYHQRGIYEMRLAGDSSALDRAERYLQRALELSQQNPTIKHSLSEMALKRSNLAQSDEEREAWRRRAENQASALIKNSRSSHPLHTMAKVAIARVRDALVRNEDSDNALTQEALSITIKEAEELLRSGLQRFPNDDRLLNEEASLSEILQNADRALQALERAFKSNKRSELVARRLSRVLRAQHRLTDAIDVIRASLELNAGSQALHYDLAQSLRESAPNADLEQADTILYHLDRSYSPGDKNHEARFWHARQLCLSGKADLAKPLFISLKQLQLPLRQKRGVRGIVRSADGSPTRYFGQVIHRGPDYIFIRADQDGLEMFSPQENLAEGAELFQAGRRVSYNLGFNLSGPIAIDVRSA